MPYFLVHEGASCFLHPRLFCTEMLLQVLLRGKPYTWLTGRSGSAFLSMLSLISCPLTLDFFVTGGFPQWDFHVCSAKKHFLWTTFLKFCPALKGFISSAVKNVATIGFLLLPTKTNPKTRRNFHRDSLYLSTPPIFLVGRHEPC